MTYICIKSNKDSFIHNRHTDSAYEDLLAKCHMSTQECQRSGTLATEVYKAVNGMTPNYIQELFEVKEIPYNLKDLTRTIIPKSNSTTYGLKYS